MPYKEPDCPICGNPLTEIDCFDNSFVSEWGVRECLGECPACDKLFRYEECFLFHHVEVNNTPED